MAVDAHQTQAVPRIEEGSALDVNIPHGKDREALQWIYSYLKEQDQWPHRDLVDVRLKSEFDVDLRDIENRLGGAWIRAFDGVGGDETSARISLRAASLCKGSERECKYFIQLLKMMQDAIIKTPVNPPEMDIDKILDQLEVPLDIRGRFCLLLAEEPCGMTFHSLAGQPVKTVVPRRDALNYKSAETFDDYLKIVMLEHMEFKDSQVRSFEENIRTGKSLDAPVGQIEVEPVNNRELYDRRIVIYHAARALLQAVMHEDTLSRESVSAFDRDTDEATFLFGNEICAFLQELRSKAIRFRTISRKLDDTRLHNDQNRQNWEEEDGELLVWFEEAHKTLKERFQPLLSVTQSETLTQATPRSPKTLTVNRNLMNLRALMNSFNGCPISSGEALVIVERPVTQGIHPHGIAVEEIEKYRDRSRARWHIRVSGLPDGCCATVDAFAIGTDETKVQFQDGKEGPLPRKPIGNALEELGRLVDESQLAAIGPEVVKKRDSLRRFFALMPEIESIIHAPFETGGDFPGKVSACVDKIRSIIPLFVTTEKVAGALGQIAHLVEMQKAGIIIESRLYEDFRNDVASLKEALRLFENPLSVNACIVSLEEYQNQLQAEYDRKGRQQPKLIGISIGDRLRDELTIVGNSHPESDIEQGQIEEI